MSEAACSANNKLLPFRTRLGIFVVFEAASISTVSASILLCYTGYRVVKKVMARRTIRRTDPQSNGLLPIDATDSLGFIVLMFWELAKALGGMLDLKWALQGCVIEGTFCTAQGYLKQIGDTGVALFSLFIGFDTFFVLVFRWRAPNQVNVGAIIGLNLLIFLFVAIGGGTNHGKHPPYIGDTIYWCWIRREYLVDQLTLEYLWIWVTAIVQIVLYVIMALVVRGSLVVEGRLLRPRTRGTALRNTMSQGSDIDNNEEENRIIANLMLFYPAIYIICVLPLSIVRWRYFARGQQTPASVLTASAIFQLSGFFNVLFYTFTRPDLVSAQNLEIVSLTAVDNTVSSRREEVLIRRSTLQGRLPDDEIQMTFSSPPVGTGSTSPTR